MKLSLDNSLAQAPVAGPVPSATRAQAGGRAVDIGSGGDSVRVSGASSALHRFSSERASRIDALSKAVSNGTYLPSSGDIGKAIIRHAGG